MSEFRGDCCAINYMNNKMQSPELSFLQFRKMLNVLENLFIYSRREDLFDKEVMYIQDNRKCCALYFELSHFINENKRNKLHFIGQKYQTYLITRFIQGDVKRCFKSGKVTVNSIL